MTDPKKSDTRKRKRRSAAEIKAIRMKAKELGLENWEKGNIQVLESKILTNSKVEANDKQESPQELPDIVEGCDKYDLNVFASIDLNPDLFRQLSKEYGFDKFVYNKKFFAFRCYRGDKHMDWVDLNDLLQFMGKQPVLNIAKKVQRPHKPVIKMRWRR